MSPMFGLALALLAVGCSNKLDPNEDGEDPRDTADRDSGDDDTTDTDDDTNPVDDAIVDCRASYVTPEPGSAQNGGECTTDELFCGDFIQATTVGGSEHYDTSQYHAAGLATQSENWDAPERVYNFRQQVGQAVRMTFYGPCGELDVAACQGWECSSTGEVQHNDCSAFMMRGDDGGYYRDLPAPGAGARDFEIIVDGRGTSVGNFAIEIECFET